MKSIFFLTIICLGHIFTHAQPKSVSITIDDVPSVRLFQADKNSSHLLKKLDSLHLPVAIFINEGNLVQSGSVQKNNDLLKSWIVKDFITVGNHSYSHQNYAEIGFDAFSKDVLRGEELTRRLLDGTEKEMKYFRFPFNSMGKDSAETVKMKAFLNNKNYIFTPFTVEGEDWLYTQLYEKALTDGNIPSAKKIGEQYVEMSLKLFDYFDRLSVKNFGHAVNQIYLCHDNRLNTDYLPTLIQKLKDKNYEFVTLENAMKDPLYQSKEYYFGPAGFSWIYRWMQDSSKRRTAMRAEPSNAEIHAAYEAVNKKN